MNKKENKMKKPLKNIPFFKNTYVGKVIFSFIISFLIIAVFNIFLFSFVLGLVIVAIPEYLFVLFIPLIDAYIMLAVLFQRKLIFHN